MEKRYFVTYNNKTIAENCDMRTALLIAQSYFLTVCKENDVVALSEWHELMF